MSTKERRTPRGRASHKERRIVLRGRSGVPQGEEDCSQGGTGGVNRDVDESLRVMQHRAQELHSGATTNAQLNGKGAAVPGLDVGMRHVELVVR